MSRMKKTGNLPLLAVLLVSMLFLGTGIFGENPVIEKRYADVSISSNGLAFTPMVNYGRLVINVAGPDGNVVTKTFLPGSSPYFGLNDFNGGQCPDGAYTYELKIIPVLEKRIRISNESSELTGKDKMPGTPGKISLKTMSQTGYFNVRGGMIMAPSTAPEKERLNDIVHLDDVIIDGSLCVGNDCYNGLAFGFDTIVLMENNLRIFFDDTSTIQNYPRNDWRIIINDSTDSGGNYFAIQDATEVSNVFVAEAGAPSNSLYIDNYGDVGINTSTPYYELHIVDGDSPCVRLEQDSSYGWTPQKWDVCGNESNFFIRDATHASKLPFRIEPEAPTDSIFIKSTGNVGLGTGSPDYTFEVERTGTGAMVVANRTDGATMEFSATGSYGVAGTRTDHNVRLRVNNENVMELRRTGDYIYMHKGGGTYDGNWVDGSSRAYKEDIIDLESQDAHEALEDLQPVRYKYKNKDEEHVGFIAEDVPELVAMKNRKGLSSMDIVGVLTKVVKDQQKSIKEHKQVISDLKKRIDKLEKKQK